jgi:hypothetical protein
MDTIIIQAEPKKKKALLEILKAFDIPFEVKKAKEEIYDPAFVKMVLEARKQKDGRILTDDYKKELFGSL